MEESYETFEEELGPARADPPPQRPVRQIRRPEIYPSRKIKEDMSAIPQLSKAEAETLPRTPTITTLTKTTSIQSPTQTETPWESVTLNRCLFVAITILVLTSGFHRFHVMLRGQGISEEEEIGLTVKRSGILRHRGQTSEPETNLWEVMFWWLPDLDDEDDEDDDDDDDEQFKQRKMRRGDKAKVSRSLRNKPLPDKKLMKQRVGKLQSKAKKIQGKETKTWKEREIVVKNEEETHETDEQNEEPEQKVDRLEDNRKKTTKG